MPSQVNIGGTTSGDYIKLDNALLDTYAQEIIYKTQPRLRFESIAEKRTELGVQPGRTLVFLKYNALTGKSAIAETATIETKTMSTATVTITVSEHAQAVAMSEFLVRTAITDAMENATHLLGNHYADNRDSLVRDSLLTLPTTIYGKAKANRAALLADSRMDVDIIRESVMRLAINKAPTYGMESYVAFVHPVQARYLRSDDAWVNAMNYAAPDNILSGEIGRIENVRFVETTKVTRIPINTQDIWSDNADTGDNTAIAANTVTDVYQAIVVGERAVGMAEALPVELRDNGPEDFGRKRSIAYYGIWGAGLIESGHGLIIESA